MTLPDRARTFSDRKWYKLLRASVDAPVIDGIAFPRFPPDELQRTFVGSANHATLAEAYVFYQFLKKAAQKAHVPLRPETRFLDFGCGWGRYLRFFWKDVKEENLHGCDINSMIVDVCRSLAVPGTIAPIDPLGQLPYPDAHFDTVMAYSVFTHLTERVHMHWVKELARVMRPGAIFCLTLEPRRFLDFIGGLRASDNAWHQMLMMHKERLADYYRQFDAGELVFMPTLAGLEDHYGDAAVPLPYVQRNWSPWFDVIDYVDKPRQFWQAVLVVRRTESAWQ